MESPPHQRRRRYAGKNPRRFEDKYKEQNPEKYPETIAKVLASGKTPAGTHIPIMVPEILAALAPQPNETVVDCTLGHGSHASAILPHLLPNGRLIGLDVDPIELPRTALRLQKLGFGPEIATIKKSNFAGLHRILIEEGLQGADCILADLGVSSMQLDTPTRGFSMKTSGPLDMRMNPERGISASKFLEKINPHALESLLIENADEPRANLLAPALAGKTFLLTKDLSEAIQKILQNCSKEEQEKSIRRVFQSIRIAINEEFTALDTLLRILPHCINPRGRIAILTFHSGEDRRVKKAFQAGYQEGIYSKIAQNVIRPCPEECRANPRASSAKLRWAQATS